MTAIRRLGRKPNENNRSSNSNEAEHSDGDSKGHTHSASWKQIFISLLRRGVQFYIASGLKYKILLVAIIMFLMVEFEYELHRVHKEHHSRSTLSQKASAMPLVLGYLSPQQPQMSINLQSISTDTLLKAVQQYKRQVHGLAKLKLAAKDRPDRRHVRTNVHHGTKKAAQDYGDIHLTPESIGRERAILRPFMEGQIYEDMTKAIYKDPYLISYFAFDDDARRARHLNEHHDSRCLRTAWHRDYFPICNTFHEIDFLQNLSRKLGHGYYKMAHELEFPFTPQKVVLKTLRSKNIDFDTEMIEGSRMEALVMERMSSSPRIVDIYGSCSTSVMIEFMPLEVQENILYGDGYATPEQVAECERENHGNLCKGNSLNISEKLHMALGMAEAIADLHGFKDGVIVHDDIQPCQYLRNESGHMKLNDFNRAEIMLWDDTHQKYCRYNNGGVYGNARAPEEMAEFNLNEKIDVYSLGNVFYVLLTGLWNFYENQDDQVVQKRTMGGEKPFIDPRYRTRTIGEAELVNVIERCFVTKPDKRASIFEIVKMLRAAVAKNDAQEPIAKMGVNAMLKKQRHDTRVD